VKEDDLSFQSIDGADTESESVQEVEDTEEEQSPSGLRRSARKTKKVERLGVHTSVPSSKENGNRGSPINRLETIETSHIPGIAQGTQAQIGTTDKRVEKGTAGTLVTKGIEGVIQIDTEGT
jgi:hypothetical protein